MNFDEEKTAFPIVTELTQEEIDLIEKFYNITNQEG